MTAWIRLVPFVLAVAAPAAEEPSSPGDGLSTAASVAPSLVRVRFTLEYDQGQVPQGRGWAERCPNCGEFHTFYEYEQLVIEQRPLETAGFLVSPTRLVTTDPMIHPRFVKRIDVGFRDQLVEARPAAYATDHAALFLDLARPLPEARPLLFTPEARPPYRAVTYDYQNGSWAVTVQSMPMIVSITDADHRFLSVPSSCLIVDKAGTPLGLSLNDELPLDESWKGSPLNWPSLSAAQRKEYLAALDKAVAQSLLRVELTFRSPKNQVPESYYHHGMGEDEDDGATQRSAVGVLVDEKRVLVLENLKPKITARLEQIRVHPPDGPPVAAAFNHSLADYGAFVATTEKPMPGPATLSSEAILKYRNKLVLAAEILVRGERRVAYLDHCRIPSFEVRWKQQVYPQPSGETENMFLFDPAGALLALPLVRRNIVSLDPSDSTGEVVLAPAAYLKEILSRLPEGTDPSNIPLPEDRENRLAWMGVELQPLTRELARANDVAHLTNDGETGAIIAYVYPDSPAARAGVQSGDVLLRLHVSGLPKPLEIVLQPEEGDGESFSWDNLDDVPEQFADQLPRPWPSAESLFTRALTDLGFGKKYQAEVFHDGKTALKEFEVVQSPAHFDSAPRFKSAPLGLTVRDLTYEVRRFFQKRPDDPGVIVSRVEPGSKASVAGLKPFEIITQVNEKPVPSVKEFQLLIANQDNLRLSVSRMTETRLVKIDMTAPTEANPPGEESDPGRPKPSRETEVRP